MPDLRLFEGNSLLRVGSSLAISDDCCCETYSPYYWCAGCRDGVFVRNTADVTDIDEVPELVLTEVLYEVTGWPELWSFPLGVANLPPGFTPTWFPGVGATCITAYKDLRLLNFSFVAPVWHSTSPRTEPSNTTSLGNFSLRQSVDFFRQNDFANLRYRYNCPPRTLADLLNSVPGDQTPSDCDYGIINYPYARVCEYEPFFGGYAAQTCCCERESEVSVRSNSCGTLLFDWEYLSIAGWNQIDFLRNITPIGPFVGDRCGTVSVSRVISTQANDPFLTNECFICGDGGALSFFTLTITATPTYEPP